MGKLTKDYLIMNIKDLYNKALESSWTLGFIINSSEDIILKKEIAVKWINSDYKDRWWADPFILDVNEKEIVLLVEEYKYSKNRGTIAELILDKNSLQVISDKEILVLDTHLSFPAIKRIGDKIFIYPENNRSGYLKMYEYDKTNHQLINGKIICNERLTDAIWTNIDGEDYILSTKEPLPNGNVLGVYKKKDNLFIHSYDINFNENIARNAGDIFEVDGHLFRPAQECNDGYGHSISIQEIITEHRHIQFKEINRLYSTHKKYNRGMHTLNEYKGFIVVDAKGYRYPYWGRFVNKLRIFVKRLF